MSQNGSASNPTGALLHVVVVIVYTAVAMALVLTLRAVSRRWATTGLALMPSLPYSPIDGASATAPPPPRVATSASREE